MSSAAASNGSGRRGKSANGNGRPAPVYRPPGAERSFVSMVEAVDPRLRVYATQFHPEKNLFEWGQAASGELLQAIPHSHAAVAVSQYFANFFVDECRASAHRFASPTDQWKQLIYHSPHWLAQPTLFSPNFVESYVFGASRPNGTRNR